MKKLSPIIILVMTAALVLSACGGGGTPTPAASSAPASPTQAPQKPVEKPAEQPVDQPPDAPNPPPATSDDKLATLEINSVENGLDALDSYKLTFNMTFEGEENGQKKTGSMTSIEEVVKNPPAKRYTVSGLGMSAAGQSGSADDKFEMIQIGDKQYMIVGTQCLMAGQADQSPLQSTLNPNDLFGSLRGEKMLGKETVNGVPTTHYLVNDRGGSVLGYVQSKTEAWVADDGGYVVKALFEATGKDQFFGNSQSDGTVRWTYELSDINAPLQIEAPADCGASEDIPMLPDATNQVSMGGTTTYNTSKSLEEVVAFYEKELEAKGWSKEDQGQISADNMAQLAFTKDASTLRLMLIADPSTSTTSVTIFTEK